MEKLSKKINPILSQTATSLDLPPETIHLVMDHHFSSLREFLILPTHSAYRIPYFGVFSLNDRYVYINILKMIQKLRTTLTPKRRESLNNELRFAFNNRHKLTTYIKSRRFKERFGSWHYK